MLTITLIAGKDGIGVQCICRFSWRLGIPEQYDLLVDALKHAEMIVFCLLILKLLRSYGALNQQ